MRTFNRKMLTLATLLAAIPAQGEEAAPAAPPPVVRAVLYPDRALLTRALEVPCGTGPVAAIFAGLPPGLDPTTLTASATGGKVEGVGLYERVLDQALSAQIRTLDEQLQQLEARAAEQSHARERALAERAQADSLLDTMGPFVVREAAADRKPRTEVWAQGLDAVRELSERADGRRRAAEAALRDIARQRAELQGRQARVASAGPRRAQDVEVLVRCAEAGRARVELSYLVGGASWAPLYEARADDARGEVELSVLAQIQQATGEPWKDVELVLSTASTRRDAKPPEPRRLYLGATLQEDQKKVLVRRDEAVSHLQDITAPSDPTAGEPLATADQGLSVQLRVPGRADLDGDGRPARVRVETLTLPAKFGRIAVPKLLPHSFRRAELVNRARYPLLPGRIDLFSGGSYTGSSTIERVAQGGRFELAFGIEESVKIRRVVLAEEAKDPGLLGSTRRLVFGYRVEVANYRPGKTELVVQEQVPVSQLDDVKVIIDPKTTAGYELAKEDGIVTWKLALEPKERRLLDLHFKVEIPDSYDSSGL